MAGTGQPDDEWGRELVRVLVRRLGYATASRLLAEEAGDNSPTPPRRRRTISPAEAARRAAAQVPPDDLARARARKGR